MFGVWGLGLGSSIKVHAILRLRLGFSIKVHAILRFRVGV